MKEKTEICFKPPTCTLMELQMLKHSTTTTQTNIQQKVLVFIQDIEKKCSPLKKSRFDVKEHKFCVDENKLIQSVHARRHLILHRNSVNVKKEKNIPLKFCQIQSVQCPPCPCLSWQWAKLGLGWVWGLSSCSCESGS